VLLSLTFIALACYTVVVATRWRGLRWTARNTERAERAERERRSFL
jgi:hypothetical protein